jgi:hypothetical protein
MKQSLFASWFETIGSTATGFAVSLCLQWLVCWWYDLPLHWHDNIAIIGLFTLASLLRGIAWRRLMEHFHVRNPISAFAFAVLAERRRQVEAEGWSTDHDDKHDHGDLARAGAAYALNAASGGLETASPPCWPWEEDWWRPAGIRRDLVKAAALILAEGERFERTRRRAGSRQ